MLSLGWVGGRLDYLFYLLLANHALHHEKAVSVDALDVGVSLNAYHIVILSLEGFEESLHAAEDIVDFPGFDVVTVGYLVSHHFEVPELLLEFQVVVVARVDIEVLFYEVVIHQLHENGGHYI